MKILISGAGVAGLTVAYWLSRYGFSPTLVERAPALLTGGYKIDVRGSALQVLREMGIFEDVHVASTDMQGAKLVDKHGKVIHEMSGNDYGHRVGEDVEIVRGELCQILKDQISEAEFIFGDEIQEIIPTSDKVIVKFQHHPEREFDLVIGADGLHSNVRSRVFGAESQFLKDLGLYLCVFGVPNYLNLDRVEMQYSDLGRVAAVWSVGGESTAKACFGFTAPSRVDLRDRSQHLQLLKAVYEGVTWEIPRFFELMPEAPEYFFDVAAQVCMPHWSQGRVVLLGDAAYCASPLSGQGTSLALIGAYILAGELAAARGVPAQALEQYETQMRPFVQANQALGIQAAKLMRSQEKKNGLTWLLELIMRMAPARLIEYFLNRATQRIQRAANAINLKSYETVAQGG